MNAYFDTSAIIALYIGDHHAVQARGAWSRADQAFTSTLAYAETLAGLAALERRRLITGTSAAQARGHFLEDWPRYLLVALDRRILPTVNQLTKVHPLTGADAVHLASALVVHRRLAEERSELRFACDDRALTTAARAEGLQTAW